MSRNINVSDLMGLGLSATQIQTFMSLRSPHLCAGANTIESNTTSVLLDDAAGPYNNDRILAKNVSKSESLLKPSGLSFEQQIEKFLRRLDHLRSKRQFGSEIQYSLEFLLNLLKNQKYFEIVQIVTKFAEVTKLEIFRKFKLVKLVFYLFLGFALKQITQKQVFSRFLLVVMDSVNWELQSGSSKILKQIQSVIWSSLDTFRQINVFDGALISNTLEFKAFEFVLLKKHQKAVKGIEFFFEEFVAKVEFFTEAQPGISSFTACDLVAMSQSNDSKLLQLELEGNSKEHKVLDGNRERNHRFLDDSEAFLEHCFPVKNVSKMINKPHHQIVNIANNKASLIILVFDVLLKEYLIKILRIPPFESKIMLSTRPLGNLEIDPTHLYVTNTHIFLATPDNDQIISINYHDKQTTIHKIAIENKIQKIVTGETHLLVLTRQKELYGCGHNDHLNLKASGQTPKLNLTKIEAFDFELIEDVFSKGAFVIVVNNQQEVQILGKINREISFSYPTQLNTPDLEAGEMLFSLNASNDFVRFLTNKGRIFEFGLRGYKGFTVKENPEKYYAEFNHVFSLRNNHHNLKDQEPLKQIDQKMMVSSCLFESEEKAKDYDFELKVVEEVLSKVNKKIQALTQLTKVCKSFKKPGIKMTKPGPESFLKNNLKVRSKKQVEIKRKGARKSSHKKAYEKPSSIKRLSKNPSLNKLLLENNQKKSKRNIIKIKRKNVSLMKKPKSTKKYSNKSTSKYSRISKEQLMHPSREKNALSKKRNLENFLPKSRFTNLKNYDLLKHNLKPVVLKKNQKKLLSGHKKGRRESNTGKKDKVCFLGYMKTLLNENKKCKKAKLKNTKDMDKSKGFTNEKIKNVLKIID